ncbi:MAG: xanthine dehydrogenase family protein molybdopterin-binding subunit, partial [Gemmatimonadota bacterium]|nr:xanthine dehydrogenase family protein molybdopterin-binding subunit [Gemmatimonadota bacterium]
MTRIGESPRRPDALGKAIGTALYAADVPIPGVFHGMTIRSPHAHAKILAIHWRPEAAPPDSVFVSAEDIRGRNGIQILDDSWPVLAREEVRHVGEPVALVAAMTRSAALEAARAVEVEYEPLTAVADMEDAEDVPLLHEIRLGTDGVEAALSRADRIITGEYRTGLQEHAYIENQAVTAWFETDGTLQITGSMQCPFYVHSALVHSLGLPEEMVRVRPTVVGGGFGGKEEYPSMLALHAALLATACGEPVRIAYDRHEDIVGTTKRHPSRVLHRTGVDAEGHIVATDIRVDLDGGAYRTLSPVVLSRAVLHAAGAYRAGVARIHGRVLRTNMPPSGAFRGFGAPQVLFAMERQMDRIARETGMNPVDIRRKNALRPGDALPTGQVLDDTTAAVECLEEAVRRTDFERKHAIAEAARHGEAEAPSKGIGVSLFLHGAGFTGEGERRMRSPVTVRLDGQGRIELLVANTEMGQGCATVLPQIAADSAGVAMEDIVLAEVDTATVPDSGPTVASRTTMVVGGVVARAAGRLAREVLAWWKERTGGEAPALHDGLITDGARDPVPFREAARLRREEVGPLEITMRYEPPDWQDFDETS